MGKLITDVNLLKRSCGKVGLRHGLRTAQKLLSWLKTNKRGIGLAAPQLGILERVCVCWAGRYEGRPPIIFVNPVITEQSEVSVKMTEGCLSLPGVHVEVSRSLWVVVETDNLGKCVLGVRHPEDGGFLMDSVVAQHEVEHTLGILITDKAE